MKAKEMIELIKQHHPHVGEKEAISLLNRAKDDFCAKTEMVKDSYTAVTEANQRYYTIDSKILKIKSVWLNDVEIPMLLGKPVIDDDTGEDG
mgnify:FL=1|tara:strand:- start:382 stop:657 length:276 start_codon:yes stop_codon:yes gene_type:complete